MGYLQQPSLETRITQTELDPLSMGMLYTDKKTRTNSTHFYTQNPQLATNHSKDSIQSEARKCHHLKQSTTDKGQTEKPLSRITYKNS